MTTIYLLISLFPSGNFVAVDVDSKAMCEEVKQSILEKALIGRTSVSVRCTALTIKKPGVVK